MCGPPSNGLFPSFFGSLLFLCAALSGWVLLKRLTTEPIVVAGVASGASSHPPRLGPRLVLSTLLGWVLTALFFLFVCTGLYAARDLLFRPLLAMTLGNPPSGKRPSSDLHSEEGPAFDASEKLNLKKAASGAKVSP